MLIWQKAMEIIDEAYVLLKQFPNDEKHALTSQIKRCSVSIPSNIAEGWRRELDKSFLNYLRIARGSLYELETQIEIALLQGFIKDGQQNKLIQILIEEGKMLSSFMNKLKSRIASH